MIVQHSPSGRIIRAVALALILLGIVLNPYLIARFFTHDHKIDNPQLVTIIALFEVISITFGILLYFISESAEAWLYLHRNELILLVSAMLGCYLILIALDLTLFNSKADGLIYKPGTEEEWSRLEFRYNISINSLGIRGPELRSSEMQNFVIGDSFTFGEGVANQGTIPSLLSERYGQSFLNLGKSGSNLGEYIQTYLKAREMIDPEKVVVIVYLGNDISNYKIINPSLKKISDALLLQNIMQRIKIIFSNSGNSGNRCSILPNNPAEFEEYRHERYLKINNTLYEMGAQNRPCHQTDINPWDVRMGIDDPDYYLNTITDIHNIRRTELKLKAFNDMMLAKGDNALFVFMPDKVQVSAIYHPAMEQLNINTNELENTDWVSDDMVQFCSLNGIECLDLLPEFKNSAEKLYWDYDTHLTTAGYNLTAYLIGKKLFG